MVWVYYESYDMVCRIREDLFSLLGIGLGRALLLTTELCKVLVESYP